MTDEEDDQEIDEYKFSIDQVSNRLSQKSALPQSDSMKQLQRFVQQGIQKNINALNTSRQKRDEDSSSSNKVGYAFGSSISTGRNKHAQFLSQNTAGASKTRNRSQTSKHQYRTTSQRPEPNSEARNQQITPQRLNQYESTQQNEVRNNVPLQIQENTARNYTSARTRPRQRSNAAVVVAAIPTSHLNIKEIERQALPRRL